MAEINENTSLGASRTQGDELTWVAVGYRVSPTSPLTIMEGKARVDMSFFDGMKAIATDSHFLVPLFVLLAGIALLVILH